MEKNWLIRTTHNKILGPISKKKLVEFIEKGSLTQNDEVTAGNGYWFSLKEEELVDRFIFTDEVQGFNPITECKTILCAKPKDLNNDDFDLPADDNTLVIGQDILSQLGGDEPKAAPAAKQSIDGQLLPCDDDLAFPDMGDMSPSTPANIPTPPPVHAKPAAPAPLPKVDPSEETDSFQGKLPSDDDLAFPDFGSDKEVALDTPSILEVAKEPPAPPKKKITPKNGEEESSTPRVKAKVTKGRSDYYLFYIFFIMMALVGYAIYFYYSKISQGQKSIYTDELGAFFVPTVYAQTIDVKKKNDFLAPLDTPYGKIAGKFNISGVHLSGHGFRLPVDECKIKSEYFFMLLYLITPDHQQRQIDDQLKKCNLPLSARVLPIYQMSKLSGPLRRKHIDSVMNDLGTSEREVISSILQKKDKVVSEIKLINAFNQFVESFDNKLPKGKRYRLRKGIETLSKRGSRNSVLIDILELLLALDMDNQAWAKGVLSRLLRKDLTRITFNINEHYFDNKAEITRFERNINRAILHIAEKLEHKMFSLLAINYFATFDQSDETARLLQNLGSKWSLSEVRDLADKKIYGELFFIPWYYILKNKAIGIEIESYVNKFLTPSMIRKLGVDAIPIFLTHLPKGKEKRKALFDVIIRSYELSDYYSRYVMIQALKSDVIRKNLSKLPVKYRGATFQLERELYHDTLNIGGLTNLSIFKLSELGEENIELLWWLVL